MKALIITIGDEILIVFLIVPLIDFSGDAREQSVRRSASKQATRALQNGTKRGTQVFGAREFRFACLRESYK